MYGNTGKIIVVNLSVGSVNLETLPENYYHRYIGGSGLAAKIFWEKGDFSVEPLTPEAMILFINGPFAGLKLSGASRMCVAGRSPLTGHWGDSSCGGHFPPELRYAGYDGIIVTGRAEKPSLILIEDERVSIEDARDYWGLGIEKTTDALRKHFGKNRRSLVIGPAGENLVRYSVILNEGHHAFGRAGYGAVMGSKNLKAIVVHAGVKEMRLADHEAFDSLRKHLNAKITEALASTLMHENGTACNLEGGVHSGDVPIRNFTSNFWEEMAEALTGSTLSENYLVGKSACAFCHIACKRIVEVREGPFAIPKGPGPEYETIVALGSLLGSMDLAAACKAGRVCNDLGLDTISAGGTIAWATEAFQKGDLTIEDTEGIDLNWGDMTVVIDEVLPRISARRGKLGDLLAEGSAKAASRLGGDAWTYTVVGKGLEAPMHDPRGGGHGLALTYAMSHRGACHVAYPMLFMEMGACYYPEIGFEYELEPMTDVDKPEAASIAVALGSIENSACYCQFADREISIPEWIGLFNTVAGYGWDANEMMRAGRRVFYLLRLVNYMCGLRAEDDVISSRLLEPATNGAPEGITINFEGMKKRFYDLMKLDAQKGIPFKETLLELDMVEESERVW